MGQLRLHFMITSFAEYFHFKPQYEWCSFNEDNIYDNIT